MVGPSSSHTAGACKIGQIARALFNGTPSEVDFYLYGSFATVYQGHATDRALLAGVLKLQTSDPKLARAFEIAEKNKLKYQFIPVKEDAPEHHPNTVRILLRGKGRHLSMVGSSIGGGAVKITHINDVPIDLEMMAGRFFSILIGHEDQKEVLEPIYAKFKAWHCPISDHQTVHSTRGKKIRCVTMLNIEDNYLKLPQIMELEKFPGIHFVRALTKLLK